MDSLEPAPSPASSDPFGIGSVGCAIGGTAVYCCGSLLCLGWLAFPIWLLGFGLGVVGAVQAPPGKKVLSIVGIVFNIMPALLFGLLMMFGVGFGVLQSILDQQR